MHTEALKDRMKEWRRDLHRHPELGFEEHRTAARVADLLESFGIETHRGIGGTGVVGVLRSGTGNRAIGLRADMDALPITEATGLPHASQRPGAMHACGHDGHTAMLLGAAAHLAEHGGFDGTVIFIFQPAEEHGRGGPAMLSDGLFERFDVAEVYGLHNMPGMAVGRVATRPGPMMASEALFEITLQGQGGHAAMPHKGSETMVAGAELVLALQSIVARRLDPGRNGVVSVTEFDSDGQRNVLPGRVVLRGDARALHPDDNAAIARHMRRIAEGVAVAHGLEVTVEYDTVFEVLRNAPDPTRRATEAAVALFGAAQVDDDAPPVLGSEDFAHMAAARPGCFLFLGNGVEGAHGRPLHSADYDFNDAALVPGSSFWVELVGRELGP